MVIIKNKKEIQIMREAGRIVAQVLDAMEKAIAPGITTEQLDRQASKLIRLAGGEPAFLGYRGFPASICASVNEELVHGIPSLRRLKEGDIISIDVGVRYQGYYGDAALTFPVGRIDESARRLMKVTRESLHRAVEKVRVGNYLSDISHVIQSYAESHNYSVVRNFVGHGIGTRMHEEPEVPNFGLPGRGLRLREGMVFAIEPMINVGSWEVEVLEDQWTVVTVDRKLCAHYEHTVAVTADGPEVLTLL